MSCAVQCSAERAGCALQRMRAGGTGYGVRGMGVLVVVVEVEVLGRDGMRGGGRGEADGG